MSEASVEIGGLPFARTDLAGATAWIIERARRRTAAVVTTSNINHVALAGRNGDFMQAILRADLNVADGWPVVWASRLLGPPLPERVAGIDLVKAVLDCGERFSLAVLGAGAERLAEQVMDVHDLVLVDELPRGRWTEEDYLLRLDERVRMAEPTMMLVGVSAPDREILAHRLRPLVRGPILCCGAAVEVIAGDRPRAPLALQTMHLEWLFRLGLEPRRLGPRYVTDGARFAQIVAREWMRHRREARATA